MKIIGVVFAVDIFDRHPTYPKRNRVFESKQTQIISCAMNDTMDPNGMAFNGVKDEIVLDNEEPISYIGQFFFLGDFAKQGMDREIR